MIPTRTYFYGTVTKKTWTKSRIYSCSYHHQYFILEIVRLYFPSFSPPYKNNNICYQLISMSSHRWHLSDTNSIGCVLLLLFCRTCILPSLFRPIRVNSCICGRRYCTRMTHEHGWANLQFYVRSSISNFCGGRGVFKRTGLTMEFESVLLR